MPIRFGETEATNRWHYDEGFLHRGFDYDTDKSVDDAYGALEESKWDDGRIDAEEIMRYILSGLDHGQYTQREARQIANAIRLHWDAMTPAAKALATRFVEEMRPRVPNIDDCSPYALAGYKDDYIWPGGMSTYNNSGSAVAVDGIEMTQLLGELAAIVGSEVR